MFTKIKMGAKNAFPFQYLTNQIGGMSNEISLSAKDVRKQPTP